MKHRIKNLLKSIVFPVIFATNYTKFLKKTSKKFINKGKKYAIINLNKDLKNDDKGRYFEIICLYFSYCGYEVVIKLDWDDMHQPRRYKISVLEQNYTFIRDSSAAINTIVLVKPGTVDHVIHLSYGFNVLQTGRFDCTAPYPMHPLQYGHYLSLTKSAGVKQSARSIKVFFAGGTRETLYEAENIEKQFSDIIPRWKVIASIVSNFENAKTFEGEADRAALKELVDAEHPAGEIVISSVKTKPEDWLKILSKIDFFVCPPGVAMPWCHNSVESMSAGAIPILQYFDLFTPKLENSKNCLTYTNLDELKIAIQRALTMEAFEKEEMRNNVRKYYNEYLSIDSIKKRIEAFHNSAQQDLKVAVPFIQNEQDRNTIKLNKKQKRSQMKLQNG